MKPIDWAYVVAAVILVVVIIASYVLDEKETKCDECEEDEYGC